MGCDALLPTFVIIGVEFQPTQPEWAATFLRTAFILQVCISIHAAQEGCDLDRWQMIDNSLFISIHAAQEGCDLIQPGDIILVELISIHAAQEGCDILPFDVQHDAAISIHAAQEGCDISPA